MPMMAKASPMGINRMLATDFEEPVVRSKFPETWMWIDSNVPISYDACARLRCSAWWHGHGWTTAASTSTSASCSTSSCPY
uniref:Uncharacterized protein n=1 Tax=Romanomermis culicivorax TaxID=13658 RepID=A0A915J986_ROMCU